VDSEALMGLYGFGGMEPQVASDAFVAPTATLIGDVVLEAESSVWFGAVLRADFGRIVVGEGSCVQDNAVIHAAEELPTVLGANVAVGHAAMLEGCVVEDGALIGMGAIVLNGARIGRSSIVGANSVVTTGKQFPENSLILGSPARVIRPLEPHQISTVDAEHYQERGPLYRKGLKRIG
jgi:carbonic anhydrase/acetyltransferase-like protein (isoleucine patch superfamily)